ncbi:PREDICTED: signal recognition particle 9 kDa protein, partial [Tauraco erythrolophus]|uniref:signal recognition particle 9 kDa protein n=1 Tax=Tauraco erythrolophus TaxID=121530 RepID=UPI0005239407
RKFSLNTSETYTGDRVSGVLISDRCEPREPDVRDVAFTYIVRVVLKYRHCDGNLCIKVTDDVACLLYRTDQAQDVKKIEKFHSQLMRLMVAKESRSAAMETD